MKSLTDVFGIKREDSENLFNMAKRFHKDDTLVVSSLLQRLWIDENMTDNLKCWAIFELGRWLGHHEHEKEGRM